MGQVARTGQLGQGQLGPQVHIPLVEQPQSPILAIVGGLVLNCLELA